MTEYEDSPEVAYKSLRKNPLDWNRNSTHAVCIYIFVSVAIVCGVSYFVIYSITSKSTNNEWRKEPMWFLYSHGIILKNSAVWCTAKFFEQTSFRNNIAAYVLFGGSMMLSFLLLICWVPRLCTYGGIILLNGLMLLFSYVLYTDVVFIYNAFYRADYNSDFFCETMFYFTHNVMRLMYVLIVLVFCVKQAGISVISNIIQKSLRSMFFFPTLILFGLLILISNVLVAFLMYLSISHAGPSTYLFYVTVFGSMYSYLCIYYFGRMVISETIATWHWTENKKEVPKFTVLRSIAIVCRYHLGAVFFAATVVLPIIAALRIACKNKFYAAPKAANPLIEIFCKLFLILNMADYALILISIHGYDFSLATKRTFQLMVRKCSLSMAVINIFYITLIIGSVAIFILYMYVLRLPFSRYIFQLPWTKDSFGSTMINESIIFIVSLVAHVHIIAESAVHTTILYTLEDEERNNEIEEKLQCDIPLNRIAYISS